MSKELEDRFHAYAKSVRDFHQQVGRMKASSG